MISHESGLLWDLRRTWEISEVRWFLTFGTATRLVVWRMSSWCLFNRGKGRNLRCFTFFLVSYMTSYGLCNPKCWYLWIRGPLRHHWESPRDHVQWYRQNWGLVYVHRRLFFVDVSSVSCTNQCGFTLLSFNIAMEHGPFIDEFPS